MYLYASLPKPMKTCVKYYKFLFIFETFLGNFTEDLFYNIMFFTNPTENKVLETFAPKYIWMYFSVTSDFPINKQL